jgi:cell division protein FtsB
MAVNLNPRLVPWLLRGGVLAVATYYGVWGGEYSMWDVRRLRTQVEAESLRVVRSRAETDSIRTLARSLENDPAMIERVARVRFGMIREGEMLVRFVDLDTVRRGGRLATLP